MSKNLMMKNLKIARLELAIHQKRRGDLRIADVSFLTQRFAFKSSPTRLGQDLS